MLRVPRPGRQRSLFGLITLALLLAGCSPETPTPPATPTVVDSYVIPPAATSQNTRLSGQVRAAERTTLSFEVAGKLEQVRVDVGDDVQAGETLATLDTTRYELVARQRQAEAREAEASLTEKRQDYRRKSRLAEKNYVSETQLDTARAALDTAESRHASALAAQQLAERDLEQTRLQAPFDGTISTREAEPSERVAANQTIFEVASKREGFEVTTSVPETLVDRLTTGSTQEVRLPALGNVSIPAILTHLGSQPRSSNDYPVILALREPPAETRAGMTAEVMLSSPNAVSPNEDNPNERRQGADTTPALTVPLTALVHEAPSQAHVWRISEARQLQRVAVRVIRLDGDQARVAGDLSAGDRIVRRGAEFVQAGQTVSLLGEGPERYN